jgi:cell division septal protein FtsQ
MAKRKNQIPVASVVILFVIVFLFIAISRNGEIEQKKFKISEISIIGNELLPKKEIQQMILPAIRDSISRYDLIKIKNKVESSPFIDEALVKIDAPAHLILNIREFSPRAILLKNKKMYYLNDRGELYPYRFLDKYEDLIVLTGKETDTQKIVDLGLTIIGVLDEYPIVRHLVSEIHFEKNQPYLILIQNAIQVRIDISRIHQNFVYLKSFIRSYGDVLNNKKIKSINLSYKNKIFISERGLL